MDDLQHDLDRLGIILMLDEGMRADSLDLLEEVRRSGIKVVYSWGVDSWALPQIDYTIDGKKVDPSGIPGVSHVRMLIGTLLRVYGNEELSQAWVNGKDLRNN